MTDTAHIRDLLSKATPGPWTVEDGAIVNRNATEIAWDIGEAYDARNAALIIEAVNALPALLDELEAARRDLRSARDLLRLAVETPNAGDCSQREKLLSLLQDLDAAGKDGR